MKFFINLFICLLFIGCVPLDSNTEDSKEDTKEKTQDNKSSSEVAQQDTIKPFSQEDISILEYLEKQLLASIDSDEGVPIQADRPKYTNRLNEFIKWLNENPDKGRELAKVGQALQELIKEKGNGTLDNLQNVQGDNDHDTLQVRVNRVFQVAYNALNGDKTNEKALDELKDTLGNKESHLDGINSFQKK
ncbi:hypothetical protein DB313_06015 (plasmid) [Borrelia turcica IST7]|uniref:Mlp family lipoprotein n=1 Tax=Borrelia turcica IST7 TaxID=1104446 RepID=A0A386PR75_9SPIR|nr:hypothetical protein [Borrelia turcica]AYE37057.1 hypothetical protein DB313_06015 [Borrelia turcica IST7]